MALLWKVFIALIRFRPQLCYITLTAKGAGFCKDASVVFLVKMFGVKRVYHFHNKGVSTRQHKWFDNAMYRCVFRKAHVILLSKYLYPDVEKYVSESRVHYCANGISENEFISEAPIKSANGVTEILFLSNLIKSKGILVLLDACKLLYDKNILFSCSIVGGEGDLRESVLQNEIDVRGLKSVVQYKGKKYGADKEEILQQSDIMVFPTYYDNECLPLVLLEAMQHGLPVISTFEGGIPDLIEDGVNGFLVLQKDAAALAEKMEILIKDSEMRQQMGAAGRKKYEEQFTLDVFENRMKNILETILSTK